MGQIDSPPLRKPLKHRGFTLLELIVGLVIIMVIATIALPPIGVTIRAVRLDSTTTNLAGDLVTARMEAMKRNTVVDLTVISRTEYDIEFVGARRLENGVTFLEAPSVVQFAPFGPTLTGPTKFVLELGGKTKTVSLTASGLPVL